MTTIAEATTEPTPESSTELVRRDNSPRGLIAQYSEDFAAVLPAHISAATFVRVAQGALKKGKKTRVKVDGKWVEKFNLEIAAENNPAAFLSALLDAARQGLEPGTAEYYLTERKVDGRSEILGMRGYQGEIELIYNAGAVSSVVAEVVKSNDKFTYRLGIDEVPNHEVDWFSGDRGELIGVYAYARMKDGAASKVVILGSREIERIMSFAQGVTGAHSPWVTSTEAMWLKSAVHQLQKWVPTSAENIASRVKAAREGSTAAAIAAASEPLRMQQDMPAIDPNVNGDMIVDADVVSDDNPPAPPEETGPKMATKVQAAQIVAKFEAFSVRDLDRTCRIIAVMLSLPNGISKVAELTHEQADTVLGTLAGINAEQDPRDTFDLHFGGVE